MLLTEPELRAFLVRDEGQFLEFKSLWDQSSQPPRPLDRRTVRDKIAEYVAAFANADGGTLLLGVEDDGTPSGHAYPEDVLQDFLAVAARRLRPAVPISSQRMVIDGHEVIILGAPMAPEAVMVDGDGFPYRTGDQVIREPQEVINQRKQSYRRVGYEQRVRLDVGVEAVDLELVRSFLSRTPFKDRRPEDALVEYGLILPRAGGFGVTNACLLLFGGAPMARWHARAGIRLFRVAGKEREHGAARNVIQLGRIESPLALAIPDAHRMAREHIRRSEKLHDLFFREMVEYPEFAWQEAIVNAFAHRDYEDATREIEVWFFDDRMEVRSPGELPPRVSLQRLRQGKRAHASRNPLLARVLVDAGLMREEGEGIPRMFEEMEESLLREPRLAIEGGEFCVTLLNEPVFSGGDPEWRRIVGRLPLTAAQRRVLVAKPEGFTNEDYRRLNKVDRDRAYQGIHEMVESGVVRSADSKGRGAVYHLMPDLHATRAFLAGRAPKIRAFLVRNEVLRNSDYRDLFGTTRHAALRDLRVLVEHGYLVSAGERRGAHYVAGAALEAAVRK